VQVSTLPKRPSKKLLTWRRDGWQKSKKTWFISRRPRTFFTIITHNNGKKQQQILQVEIVEEPYPKQSKEDKPQQPAANVVNPIIEYAVIYDIYNRSPDWGLVQKYKRYWYIYEYFQYLTGIDPMIL
jgi:hypothetical protein